jgi:GntR family transcriptional regulator of vanillate catabolism
MTTSARGNQTGRTLLQLRELILEGEIEPGRRVSENWAVERTAASRTPVRAALMRLEAEGFLEPLDSGGYTVRRFTERDVFDAIEIRGVAEGLGARRAAESGVGAEDMAQLDSILDGIDATIADELDPDALARYAELNHEFHDGLKALSSSPMIAAEVDRANAFPFASDSGLVIAQSRLRDGRLTLLIAQDQHRAVLDAIRRRQGARAEALMREHALLAARNLRAAIGDTKTLELVRGGAMITAEVR